MQPTGPAGPAAQDEETRVIKSREFTLDRLSFHLEDSFHFCGKS